MVTIGEVKRLLEVLPEQEEDFQVVLRLMRSAKEYHKWAEAQCNRQLTTAEFVQWDSVEETIVNLARRVGASEVVFNTDPNGNSTTLVLPDGQYDTVDHSGWAVPQL